MRWIVCIFLCAGGCWSSVLDEATQPHTDPGGKVTASMGAGAFKTSTALATAKSEPMTVEGTSPELTFSLTAGDTQGGTALSDLEKPPASTTLTLRPGGRSQLEIHLDGSGCVAVTGTVALSVDENNHLSGDFDADGTVSGGSAACHITGTLADVPIMH